MEVSGLFVYPVKSLRGISLQGSAVGMRGLRFDRHWMVVDENGKFRTQRQLSQMTSIATRLEDGLVLSAEGGGEVVVPFESFGPTIEATIWNWTGPAVLVDPKADRWLTEVLDMPCRLVAMAPQASRIGWAGEIDFPDGTQILVVGEASLTSLNSRLDDPVPMDRFRANIVLKGSDPYEEDEWTGIQVGDVDYAFVKRCGRCLVTTTDQRTGARHPAEEPLRTLARERLFGKSACFGAYYAPQSEGEIEIGMSVQPWPVRG